MIYTVVERWPLDTIDIILDRIGTTIVSYHETKEKAEAKVEKLVEKKGRRAQYFQVPVNRDDVTTIENIPLPIYYVEPLQLDDEESFEQNNCVNYRITPSGVQYSTEEVKGAIRDLVKNADFLEFKKEIGINGWCMLEEYLTKTFETK